MTSLSQKLITKNTLSMLNLTLTGEGNLPKETEMKQYYYKNSTIIEDASLNLAVDMIKNGSLDGLGVPSHHIVYKVAELYAEINSEFRAIADNKRNERTKIANNLVERIENETVSIHGRLHPYQFDNK